MSYLFHEQNTLLSFNDKHMSKLWQYQKVEDTTATE